MNFDGLYKAFIFLRHNLYNMTKNALKSPFKIKKDSAPYCGALSFFGHLSENEPEKYVSENKEGRCHKENKNTGGNLIPDFLPLNVLCFFLPEGNELILDFANACLYVCHF